jgi:murein DD-endopeptidase MepM/ murein hydrolase activator NlpD
MAALLLSGLFAATPLGGGADGSVSSFQALAGAVVLHADVSYRRYIAAANDTPESIAKRFHIQVGGFYKLNNLLAGQELTAGKSYKIPYDPKYGADYRPPSIYGEGGSYGATTYGDSQWTSKAGDPPNEVPCGVDGHGVPTAYQLQPPNPGSHFVAGRGFSWFHDGIDLGGPRGNPIRAAQAGEVIWAGYANDGFGFSIKINHCFHLSTAYCHLDALNVQVHDHVQPGDVIGFEGSTGWSTAPHLHFKVNADNVAVDPLPYYGGDMNRLAGATP